MPGEQVEDPGAMDTVRETGFPGMSHTSWGHTMELGNLNEATSSWGMFPGDGIAMDITLDDFPNKNYSVPLSASFLAVDSES